MTSTHVVTGSTMSQANVKAIIVSQYARPSEQGSQAPFARLLPTMLSGLSGLVSGPSAPESSGGGAPFGECLRQVVKHVTGADVPERVCTPSDAVRCVDWSAVDLESFDKPLRVVVYGVADPRNHVEFHVGASGGTVKCTPTVDSFGLVQSVEFVMPLGKFFLSDYFKTVGFNASPQQGSDDGEFGGGLSHVIPGAGFKSPPSKQTSPVSRSGAGVRSEAAPPVVDQGVASGYSNVGGVQRAKRVLSAKMVGRSNVVKAYTTSAESQFNNVEELFLDRVSPTVAQEIVEEFFKLCGVPFAQPKAMRYAEDVTKLFLIARTASDKADYNATFVVPVEPVRVGGEQVDSVELDFSVLSRILTDVYTSTRRQFARGYADSLREYLMNPANSEVLPLLADRAGCELQMATLAFDGSTGCTGKTVSERQFVTLLESRNLFESSEVLATDASKKLMMGRY